MPVVTAMMKSSDLGPVIQPTADLSHSIVYVVENMALVTQRSRFHFENLEEGWI